VKSNEPIPTNKNKYIFWVNFINSEKFKRFCIKTDDR